MRHRFALNGVFAPGGVGIRQGKGPVRHPAIRAHIRAGKWYTRRRRARIRAGRSHPAREASRARVGGAVVDDIDVYGRVARGGDLRVDGLGVEGDLRLVAHRQGAQRHRLAQDLDRRARGRERAHAHLVPPRPRAQGYSRVKVSVCVPARMVRPSAIRPPKLSSKTETS